MRIEVINKIESSPLDQVDLGGMNIQDDELPDIMAMIVRQRSKAKEIFLDKNKIGDQGVTSMIESLISLKQLSTLDVQFNRIGEDGARALYALKETHPNISLTFHGNHITDVAKISDIEKEVTTKFKKR